MHPIHHFSSAPPRPPTHPPTHISCFLAPTHPLPCFLAPTPLPLSEQKPFVSDIPVPRINANVCPRRVCTHLGRQVNLHVLNKRHHQWRLCISMVYGSRHRYIHLITPGGMGAIRLPSTDLPCERRRSRTQHSSRGSTKQVRVPSRTLVHRVIHGRNQMAAMTPPAYPTLRCECV